MKSIRSTLPLFFALVFTGPPNQINWKKLHTETQVHDALAARLPTNGNPSEVKKVLEFEKHAFLQQYGDTLITFISPEVRASLLISRKWLLRFHFQNKVLTTFTAREALTGP
jgi:hypothetical protein